MKFSPKVDIVSPRLEERTSDQISSSSSEIKEEVEDFDMESDEDQEVTFHTSHVQVQGKIYRKRENVSANMF